ncbi:MAG: hypothetical protein ACFE9L_12450 [Candidatus Hodarchaeota archaeon]
MKCLKDPQLFGRNRPRKGDDMFLPRFLGIEAIPNARNLIMKFLVIILIISIIGNLSSTFFVLYTYDKIGPSQAGIIISFTLLIQLLTDYPSGSLVIILVNGGCCQLRLHVMPSHIGYYRFQ